MRASEDIVLLSVLLSSHQNQTLGPGVLVAMIQSVLFYVLVGCGFLSVTLVVKEKKSDESKGVVYLWSEYHFFNRHALGS
jgi:hypothetical protein